MKKQKLMAVVLFTAFAGLFVACSDDDVDCIADYEGTLTTEETAFAGTWNLTAIVSDVEIDLTDDDEDNPSTDLFAQQTDCQNDQQYIFKTDRVFGFARGENAEDCEGSGSLTGTWKLGGTTLGMIYYCSENIVELEFNADETTFSYSSPVSFQQANGENVEAEVTFTYTKEPVVEETE